MMLWVTELYLGIFSRIGLYSVASDRQWTDWMLVTCCKVFVERVMLRIDRLDACM